MLKICFIMILAMIPNDPLMLLSFINTKLRDEYESLDELCDSLDISKEEILTKLEVAGYHYEQVSNKFVRR